MIFVKCSEIDGTVIVNTFPSDISHINFNDYLGSKPFLIKHNERELKARVGIANSEKGSILVLTTEKKYVNRLKSFRELCNTHLTLLDSIKSVNMELIDQKMSQIDELIHNLTSLNSYTIQDLFALVPQKVLSDNITKQTEIVKSITKERPIITATTVLNMIKYSLAQKMEFSVFERTLKDKTSTQSISTNIREIVLSVLQIFISDFEEKTIELFMTQCNERKNIDPDLFSVAIFYILENALKYSIPRSRLNIFFDINDGELTLKFDMISIKIEDYEMEKICELNYRSAIADRLKIKGKGIGMYKSKLLLSKCNCNLEILPRKTPQVRMHKNEKYEHNQFIITLK